MSAALIEQLRQKCQGRDEWRVQDPKDGAYCIAFSLHDGFSFDPEREARAWLADRQRRFPDSSKAGYVVACVRVQTQAEHLMSAAADEIDRLNAQRREWQTERESLLARLASSGVEARRQERERLQAERAELLSALRCAESVMHAELADPEDRCAYQAVVAAIAKADSNPQSTSTGGSDA